MIKEELIFLEVKLLGLVQNKWDKNFNNEINIVIGDEWYAEICHTI